MGLSHRHLYKNRLLIRHTSIEIHVERANILFQQSFYMGLTSAEGQIVVCLKWCLISVPSIQYMVKTVFTQVCIKSKVLSSTIINAYTIHHYVHYIYYLHYICYKHYIFYIPIYYIHFEYFIGYTHYIHFTFLM